MEFAIEKLPTVYINCDMDGVSVNQCTIDAGPTTDSESGRAFNIYVKDFNVHGKGGEPIIAEVTILAKIRIS